MPSSRYERAARSAGYRTIAGLDEAGRGVPAVCPKMTYATDKIAKVPNIRILFFMMDRSGSRTYEFNCQIYL
jgi:hypothetical protein